MLRRLEKLKLKAIKTMGHKTMIDSLECVEKDCPEDKIPVVVSKKPNSEDEYVTLNLDDFMELIDKDKIFDIEDGGKIDS